MKKSKYSRTKKYVRMSLNKYNLLNRLKIRRHLRYIKKKGRSRNLRYKKKLLAKQRFRAYFNLKEKEIKKLLRLASWYRNKFSRIYNNLSLYKYFLINLERRLDRVLFKLKWAPSIFAATQLIKHGHILVNGKIIYSYGYILSINDLIQINYRSIEFIRKLNQRYRNSFFRPLIRKRFYEIKDRIDYHRKYKKIRAGGKYNKFITRSINFKNILRILKPCPKYLIQSYKSWSAIFLRVPRLKEFSYPFNIKVKTVKRYYKKIRH